MPANSLKKENSKPEVKIDASKKMMKLLMLHFKSSDNLVAAINKSALAGNRGKHVLGGRFCESEGGAVISTVEGKKLVGDNDDEETTLLGNARGNGTNLLGETNVLGEKNVSGGKNGLGEENAIDEKNKLGGKNVLGGENVLGGQNMLGETNDLGGKNLLGGKILLGGTLAKDGTVTSTIRGNNGRNNSIGGNDGRDGTLVGGGTVTSVANNEEEKIATITRKDGTKGTNILCGTFGVDGDCTIVELNDNEKEDIASMVFQEAMKSVICGHDDDDTTSNTGTSEWDSRLAPWIYFFATAAVALGFFSHQDAFFTETHPKSMEDKNDDGVSQTNCTMPAAVQSNEDKSDDGVSQTNCTMPAAVQSNAMPTAAASAIIKTTKNITTTKGPSVTLSQGPIPMDKTDTTKTLASTGGSPTRAAYAEMNAQGKSNDSNRGSSNKKDSSGSFYSASEGSVPRGDTLNSETDEKSLSAMTAREGIDDSMDSWNKAKEFDLNDTTFQNVTQEDATQSQLVRDEGNAGVTNTTSGLLPNQTFDPEHCIGERASNAKKNNVNLSPYQRSGDRGATVSGNLALFGIAVSGLGAAVVGYNRRKAKTFSGDEDSFESTGKNKHGQTHGGDVDNIDTDGEGKAVAGPFNASTASAINDTFEENPSPTAMKQMVLDTTINGASPIRSLCSDDDSLDASNLMVCWLFYNTIVDRALIFSLSNQLLSLQYC